MRWQRNEELHKGNQEAPHLENSRGVGWGQAEGLAGKGLSNWLNK